MAHKHNLLNEKRYPNLKVTFCTASCVGKVPGFRVTFRSWAWDGFDRVGRVDRREGFERIVRSVQRGGRVDGTLIRSGRVPAFPAEVAQRIAHHVDDAQLDWVRG